MPTESFFEDLILDTPEKIQRLLDLLDEADKRGPYVPTCDTWKEIEENSKRIKDWVF